MNEMNCCKAETQRLFPQFVDKFKGQVIELREKNNDLANKLYRIMSPDISCCDEEKQATPNCLIDELSMLYKEMQNQLNRYSFLLNKFNDLI